MATLPRDVIPESGTYERELDISVAGQNRNYLIHIPKNYSISKKVPLVVLIHGAFSTAKHMQKQSGFSELADREGFLVAYPNGAFGLFGFFQHWNAGHCCGKAQSDNIDDVGFLVDVIKDIQHQFNVDSSRIYMVGFSNGGMLTYRFAAEHTEILAAAAPMAASLGGRASAADSIWIAPQPKSKLPLIIFHAEDDRHVPYSGGSSPKKGGEREYVSVKECINFWIENNGCAQNPIEEKIYQNAVTHKTWSSGLDDNDIELYLLKEWGHKWPGGTFTKNLDTVNPLSRFDAAELIWQFFKKHER
ncbi:MAG: dienelactone hydrolase family protein [Calditrichaceae bacterium]|nr:dienelactone hydrolase family protein [Calditrichaceae bacterium]